MPALGNVEDAGTEQQQQRQCSVVVEARTAGWRCFALKLRRRAGTVKVFSPTRLTSSGAGEAAEEVV